MFSRRDRVGFLWVPPAVKDMYVRVNTPVSVCEALAILTGVGIASRIAIFTPKMKMLKCTFDNRHI